MNSQWEFRFVSFFSCKCPAFFQASLIFGPNFCFWENRIFYTAGIFIRNRSGNWLTAHNGICKLNFTQMIESRNSVMRFQLFADHGFSAETCELQFFVVASGLKSIYANSIGFQWISDVLVVIWLRKINES